MKILMIVLLISLNALAGPITDIKIIADIMKESSEEVVVKNENGEFKIPRAAIKNKNIKKGKAIELYIDSEAYENLRAQFILDKHEVKDTDTKAE